MRSITVILFLIAVGTSAALVVLLLSGGDAQGGLGWLALTVGLFLCFGELVVKRNDRLRLFLLRWGYRFRGGPSLPWALTVSFRGDFSSGVAFDHIEKSLLESLTDRVRVVHPRPANARQFVVQGMGFIEIALDDVDEMAATTMHVDFSGLRVAPHESAQVLEREILPLVAQISTAAGGGLRQESWSLKVSFDPDSNPFLGLYLRDRDQSEVAIFRTTLLHGVSAADKVDIDKSGIYLSSANSASLLTLARDFLTFSGRAVAPANRA